MSKLLVVYLLDADDADDTDLFYSYPCYPRHPHQNLSVLFLDLLLNDSVYDSYERQFHDITVRAFFVGEVDRFVQTHLDRADRFADAECIEQLISTVGRTQDW